MGVVKSVACDQCGEVFTPVFEIHDPRVAAVGMGGWTCGDGLDSCPACSGKAATQPKRKVRHTYCSFEQAVTALKAGLLVETRTRTRLWAEVAIHRGHVVWAGSCSASSAQIGSPIDASWRIVEEEEAVNVVFDGPPSPTAPRLVGIETDDGEGVEAGEWIERPDGLWVLRLVVNGGTNER